RAPSAGPLTLGISVLQRAQDGGQQGTYYLVAIKRELLARDNELAVVLPHEWLSHAAMGLRAEKAGVFEAHRVYWGNEGRAKLVGWVVAAELGAALSQYNKDLIASYLSEAGGYERHLRMRSDFYARLYARSQLADPVTAMQELETALRERLAALERRA